jgi:hypothetical protein
LHDEAMPRAPRLLQYIVDGRTDAPEALLTLNKILCGVPAHAPIAPAFVLTEREQSVCERLLCAIISNWTTIQNTSPAGLREMFLQREGRLQQLDGKWELEVRRRTIDVQVDQIPWGIAVTHYAWMPQPVYVTW